MKIFYKNLICLIALLLMVVFTSSAQNKRLEKADKLFRNFNYNSAIDEYKKLYYKNEVAYYSTYQIAKCYSKLCNPEESVKWFKKTIQYPDANDEVYDLLALECKKIEQYDEANKYIEISYQLKGQEVPENILMNSAYVNWLKRDSSSYHIASLPINTKYSEFGPALYKDHLVFSSDKKINQAINRYDVRNHSRFYKLYTCKIFSLNAFGKVRYFKKSLRSSFNDGPVCFNSDYTQAFITSNSQYRAGASYLNVFICDCDDKNWLGERNAVPLAHKGFSQMHAFLTHDESKVYFVSDIMGGYGGTDIYVSNYKNGFLSPPENLGPTINTPGNESFPFVDENGVLFFTSDGHQGLGGLDVYYSVCKDDVFSEPVNLGYPLNTSYDDFNLMVLSGKNEGYFCSNRKESKGEDDIFSFVCDKKYTQRTLHGVILEAKDGTSMTGVTIELLYKGDVIKQYSSNEEGHFNIQVDRFSGYSLRFSYPNYQKVLLDALSLESGSQEDIRIRLTHL